MAWRCPGEKPLSEPMLISLPTHICVTRPQWVNATYMAQNNGQSHQLWMVVSIAVSPSMPSAYRSVEKGHLQVLLQKVSHEPFIQPWWNIYRCIFVQYLYTANQYVVEHFSHLTEVTSGFEDYYRETDLNSSIYLHFRYHSFYSWYVSSSFDGWDDEDWSLFKVR